MNLSLLEIFTLLGVIHCFMLSLAILFSRFFRSAVNNYLGFSLLIISIVGLNNWFWDINRHPLLISLLDLPLWQFLYPVTFFIFFIKAAQGRRFSHQEKVLLFAPFTLLTVCNTLLSLDHIFNLISLDIPAKDRVNFWFYKAVSLLSIFFTLFWTTISFREVFLKKSERDTKWLRLIWIFISFLGLYGMVLEGFRLLYGPKMPVTFLWVFISAFIYWLIYNGIYRFKLSNEQYEIRQLLKRSGKSIPAAPDEDQSSPYLAKLEELFKAKGIHRDPRLSRDDVAEKLGISGGYLSQLLNKKAQKSFSDYLNAYRIEDVKKMMHNPDFDNYSLLSIGLEAGFNSKTAFYTSFKKETGMTPNEFKKSKKVPIS